MGSGRKIFNHSNIYLAGSILQRAVGFIMLPIYTRYLSPADYGIIELLTLAIDLVGLVFGLRIAQSIFKFYATYSGKDKDEVITTALFLVVGFSSVGVSLIAIFSRQIAHLTFGNEEQVRNLILFSLTLLGQGLVAVPMTSIKAAQKPVFFVIASTIKLVLQLSLNIYFVVYLGMKVEGVIYSAILATGIMALILCSHVFYTRGMSFSRTKARQLMTFSFPLLVADVFSFYITFGDRYFLRIYHGVDQVGIYSLGYRFGVLLPFLVTQPFSGIWNSERFNIVKQKAAQSVFAKVFSAYSLVLVGVTLLISLFVKDVVAIMASEEFAEAYRVVPIILASYIFVAWTSYVNLGVFLKDKTVEILYGTILSVVVISAGYFTLIPAFGGMGAAAATVFAQLARLVWVGIRSRKLYDMGLEWKPVVAVVALAVAVYLVGSFSPENVYWSIAFNVCLFGVFVLVLIFTPIMPRQLKISIKDEISSRLGR